MTLAIERPTDPLLDEVFVEVDLTDSVGVGPDVPEADETCRRCGTNACVYFVGETTDTVFALGEKPGLKYSWQCDTCGSEWTTSANQTTPCPDGFSWCGHHETDGSGGEYHGGAYVAVTADRDGWGRPSDEMLLVTCSRSDVGGVAGEPTVFLLPGTFTGSVLLDALGFTLDAARALAETLTAAVDAVEGEV